MLALVILVVASCNAWSNISGKPEFSMEISVPPPDLSQGFVKLAVPWSTEMLEILRTYKLNVVRPNVTDQFDQYHGILEQCNTPLTTEQRIMIFWVVMNQDPEVMTYRLTETHPDLIKACFTKDIVYKTANPDKQPISLKTPVVGTYTKADFSTTVDDSNKFEEMKDVIGFNGKTQVWEDMNTVHAVKFDLKLIPEHANFNYSDRRFYDQRTRDLFRGIDSTWKFCKTLYPLFIRDVIEKIDNALAAHPGQFHESDSPYSVDQVSVETKIEHLIGTDNKPELLSLFFEGLQTTGMTGMAVSRSAVGSLLSGAVGMTGYLGQAVLLLTQINRIPPTPSDPYKHQVFLSKTGQRHCKNPDVPLTVHAGSSLYNTNSSLMTDTLITVVTVTTGSGIVNNDLRVGCWNSMLKSLTVTSNKILKYEKSEGSVHYWTLINLDYHLRYFKQLDFSCGSEPTLRIVKEVYEEPKLWRPTDTTGDPSGICDIHPLKKIGWNTMSGCSISPMETLEGHYTCGQLLAGASKLEDKFMVMTDIGYGDFVKTFEFGNKSMHILDFVNSKAARSLCNGGLENGCIWPEALWTYNDRNKQRTFVVGLNAEFSQFEFRCPSGTHLNVSDTFGNMEWTISDSGVVSVSVTGAFNTFTMECINAEKVTDKFEIFKSQGFGEVSTEVVVTDYRRDWFKTSWDPIYSGDKTSVNGLKVQDQHFTFGEGVWTGNLDQSVCLFSDGILECSGLSTNVPLTFVLSNNIKSLTETTFVFRDLSYVLSEPSDIPISVDMVSRIKKLETLLTIGTGEFSHILSQKETQSWPGTIYIDMETLIEDFENARSTELHFKETITTELINLQKEIGHALGIDSDMYCCYDNGTTTLEFWNDEWSCHGLIGCFEKVSVRWPMSSLDVYDSIINTRTFLTNLVKVFVELSEAPDLNSRDIVQAEIEEIKTVIETLEESPRPISTTTIYVFAVLLGGMTGLLTLIIHSVATR